MEDLLNNLRGTVAQSAGKELRRPQNLYMHITSESTQQKYRPVFDFLKIFLIKLKVTKLEVFLN